jgi:serine/threonine kinase PknH
VSDAEATRQRSDSARPLPLQTGPLPGADAAPPHPGAYLLGPRPEADPPESMFGPYRLQELIGRGGMGEIYRAYDTTRGRIVALKRLPAALAADPVFQARFRSEAALAARLHEPHVIPIHDFGEIDGQLYIDMRLVDGPDLATVLDRGPLPPYRVVDIITQVAAALDAAHAAGLVHRDIKPANILITGPEPGGAGGDFVYVADFGIARAVDGSASGSLTSTGTMVGSLDYIAPERFDRDPGDRRVDIYALGCVLFQALTGRRPFPVEGLPAIINAHLNTPPPPASQLRPSIPPGLDTVIARAMAKHPDHRYPTAAALALDARRALDDATATVAPNLSALTTPPDQRPHSPAAWLDRPLDNQSRATGPVAPAIPPLPLPAPSLAPAAPDVRDARTRSRRWLALGVALTAILALVVAVSWSLPGLPMKATASAPATPSVSLAPTTPPVPSSSVPSQVIISAGVAAPAARAQAGPGRAGGQASGPSAEPGPGQAPCTVHITTSGLSTITLGVAWSTTLTATGCRSPYTWSLVSGKLPVGINLRSDGTLEGTATAPGVSPVKLQATSADGLSATRSFTMTTHEPFPPGDLDRDGDVDCDDLAILRSHYGQSGTAVQGDLNNDNTVNVTDLSIQLSHWTGGSGACDTNQPLAE